MPNKELFERCLLTDFDQAIWEAHQKRPGVVLRASEIYQAIAEAQVIQAIPIIAEEIKKGLEKEFSKRMSGMGMMNAVEGIGVATKVYCTKQHKVIDHSEWQTFWGEYLK